jgi:hypothetical protein
MWKSMQLQKLWREYHNFIETGFSCRICGFHSGGYEEYHLLGYDAV